MKIKNDIIKSVDSIIIHHPYSVDVDIKTNTEDFLNKFVNVKERKVENQKVVLTGYNEAGVPFCITVTGNVVLSFERRKIRR